MEGYVFAAMVYFAFCFSASRYAAWLERRQQDGARTARAAAAEQTASRYADRLAVRSEASTA